MQLLILYHLVTARAVVSLGGETVRTLEEELAADEAERLQVSG